MKINENSKGRIDFLRTRQIENKMCGAPTVLHSSVNGRRGE